MPVSEPAELVLTSKEEKVAVVAEVQADAKPIKVVLVPTNEETTISKNETVNEGLIE